MKLTIKATFFLLFLTQLASAQYLHRQGKIIIDGTNKEIMLRGMGLGGWMLQEGYMLETSSFAGTQHEIRAKIESLIGVANTDTFYNAWLNNHCTDKDIDSLAAWGFNSVRLPMHYNIFTLPIEEEPVAGADTWLPKGFARVDSLLNWCKKAGIYLILDLHAAPGGQGKDASISDYDSKKPSLWESAENRRKTVALWRKLAERYANEPYIGGYDLINETNWAFTSGGNINGCGETNNLPLRDLYVSITKAIREVDKNHLIFVEGNCWSGNFEDLTPPWDSNMAYSFHKYWNATNMGTIQSHLNMRDSYNVPLWMGESGENSNQWFYETIKMLESSHVGWSWWPLKKISSVVGPLTVKKTTNYQTLLNYWSNGGAKPDQAFATNALMEITENLKIKNCIFHPDYIDAMFRQQTTDETKPFKKHEIPGVLTASDFDLGKAGIAYSDKVTMKEASNGAAWNDGWYYRNDGVDIDVCNDTDARSKAYCIGWIDANEWAVYSVDVKQTAAYTIVARFSSGSSGGTFHIESNGVNVSGAIRVNGTGGWQSWQNITIPNIILYQGKQKLKIVFDTAGYNLSFIDWRDPQPTSSVSTKIANAETTADGGSILVNINKQIDKRGALRSEDFEIKIDNNTVPISSISYSNESGSTVILTIDKALLYGNVAKISYSGKTLKSDDGVVLSAFADVMVQNNTPFRTTLPGKIEAEKYQVNSGLSVETCTDTGGGQDMGYTNAGDYLDYLVYVPQDGNFSFEYRVASTYGGIIELRLADDPAQQKTIHSVTVPNTGGWQTWRSVSANGALPGGPHVLRIYIKQAEFNINWMKVSFVTGLNSIDKTKKIEVFPNPVKDQIMLYTKGLNGNYTLKIVNLQGVVIRQYPVNIDSSPYIGSDFSIFPDGAYILTIENRTEKYLCRIIKLNN